MTDDLVKRLRAPCFEIGLDEGWIDAQRAEAADRIERLEAAQDRAYWYRQGKDDGIEQERGNIVEWLRKQDDPSEKWALQNSHWYAAEIEAGEHLK